MIEEKTCPCCGHQEIVRDERTKEVYCNHCGLIIEDTVAFAGSHEWETSHEPLSDGLSLKAEMGKRERRANYKSSSKNQYDKLKSRFFYPLLQPKLLKMGFCLSEIDDIFNKAFLQYYIVDTDSNAPFVSENGKKKQYTREELVENFLNSLRFEEFNVTASVSRISLENSVKTLGYLDNLDPRTVNRILAKENRENYKKWKKTQKKHKKNS